MLSPLSILKIAISKIETLFFGRDPLACLHLTAASCLEFVAQSGSIDNSVVGESSTTVYHTKKDKRNNKKRIYLPRNDIAELTEAFAKENWYDKKKYSKSRNNEKIKKSDRRKFKPHFGVEKFATVIGELKALAQFANVNLPDSVLRRTEGLVALFVNLQTCTTYQHFSSAVFLYVRDFYDVSMTKQIMAYVNDVIHGSVFDKQDNALPQWLEGLKDLQTNWSLVRNNKAFKQVSKLLGVLVTLGLCEASELQFDILGFKLLDENLYRKHLSATDLADALFGTIAFFAEGAYLCFKTGSLKPLLMNDFAVLEMDEEYANIMCWWDLVKCGNLEKFSDISDNEFGRRLTGLITRLTDLSTTTTGLDKKLIMDKLLKCKSMRNELVMLKISSGTRKSPFAVELFGESSQGKTTFGDQLLDALLTSASLPIDKEYRAALNPGDKFFSNWTSDKLVAIFDDMGNEKSTFVEKPPTRAIIDFCNNQMYYAPKAELEAKGKCFVEPEVVLVTTNVKDLDSRSYSNCPYSIQRRMDLVFTVKCKSQFQRKDEKGRTCGVDSRKVRERYTDSDGIYRPDVIDDIWEITVEQAVKPANMTEAGKYAPVSWRGQLMENVSASIAISCAIEYYSHHRENQKALMEGMKMRNSVMAKCDIDGCCFIKGKCPVHCAPVNEKQFGLRTAVVLKNLFEKTEDKIIGDANRFGNFIERTVTDALYEKATNFLDKWDWVCIVPEKYLLDDSFVDFTMWYYKEDIESQTVKYRRNLLLLCMTLVFINIYLCVASFVCYITFGFLLSKSMTKKKFIDELKRRNDSLPIIVRHARDKYAKNLCYACTTIAALYTLYRVYNAWKKIRPKQSNLQPATPVEVKARDEAKDVWAKVVKRSLPVEPICQTMTTAELMNVIKKNMFYASVHVVDDQIMMANVVMLTSNVMLIPSHYFEKSINGELLVECRKDEGDAIGGRFRTRLHLSSTVKVPNTDFCICYTPNGGSFRDLTPYLPIAGLSDHPFHLLWRRIEGDFVEAKGLAEIKETSNGVCVFKGGEYRNLTINTFGGLCGAAIIAAGRTPCVSGFHLGGKAGSPYGCFGTLHKHEAVDAIANLRKIEGVIVSGHGNKFTPQMFGKPLLEDGEIHDKSPVKFLPEGSQFAYYGRCPGQTTSRSDVRKTPISAAVEDICGVENIWGPPKMKPEWYGWQLALANASEPGIPFPHDLLVKSVKDYKRPLCELASSEMWQSQPLDDHTNLCGKPGCKFIDAINLNTSMGYPLTGSKRKFVIELEPTNDKPNNREFEPVVMDEIKRVEDLYRKGERAFIVAKACKKDEVLPVKKEKCRIFYGNSIVLTFLVRKYYLPVLRFLQMNPLLSECAVGINSHGPEWDEFYRHATHFGEDRILGGDYGKYDQKLPSQLLFASLRILIDISKEMGYDQESRDIMEAMTGDLVYSLIAFNGDLIGLQSGTHISGNSLTVILNGICGSLNLRNYFYSRYDESVNFRDAAHMMTYGDDNIGSVSPDFPEFNIKGVSEFLAGYGQVYTMPDKESELVPYLNIDDFEFLKRFNVHHTDLNCNVGALLDKSIFKSLHCYLRPKGCVLTPNEACAQNIDNALREWFNHGREIYEMRRSQMQEVAKQSNIEHMCTLLDETYDDRVVEWKWKYADGEKPNVIHEFEVQSGVETRIATDLYEMARQDVGMKCTAEDMNLLDVSIGEVDLLFQKNVDGQNYYVIVEIKHSDANYSRRKGRKQLKRLVKGLATINPHLWYCGILLTFTGYERVIYTGDPDLWADLRLPVSFPTSV